MFFRPALLLFLLLIQAVQGVAWTGGLVPTCQDETVTGEHSCCAWMIEKGVADACECLDSDSEFPVPAPVSLPQSAVRESLPLISWLTLDEPLVRCSRLAGVLGRHLRLQTFKLGRQPHVRLAVLHCSFLT